MARARASTNVAPQASGAKSHHFSVDSSYKSAIMEHGHEVTHSSQGTAGGRYAAAPASDPVRRSRSGRGAETSELRARPRHLKRPAAKRRGSDPGPDRAVGAAQQTPQPYSVSPQKYYEGATKIRAGRLCSGPQAPGHTRVSARGRHRGRLNAPRDRSRSAKPARQSPRPPPAAVLDSTA
jgi:hypothetical protein